VDDLELRRTVGIPAGGKAASLWLKLLGIHCDERLTRRYAAEISPIIRPEEIDIRADIGST